MCRCTCLGLLLSPTREEKHRDSRMSILTTVPRRWSPAALATEPVWRNLRFTFCGKVEAVTQLFIPGRKKYNLMSDCNSVLLTLFSSLKGVKCFLNAFLSIGILEINAETSQEPHSTLRNSGTWAHALENMFFSSIHERVLKPPCARAVKDLSPMRN